MPLRRLATIGGDDQARRLRLSKSGARTLKDIGDAALCAARPAEGQR